MNLNVELGVQTTGEPMFLDFQKESLHTILLLGATGSGKGVFHNNLYFSLMNQNAPDELGFVFIDNTRVDFVSWKTKYALKITVNHNEGLEILEEYVELAEKRFNDEADNSKAIFIHIEECDLMAIDATRVENAWKKFHQFKDKSNIYAIFSTSRPSTDVLTKTILDNTDLKVVFTMASDIDSRLALGSDIAAKFTEPGQRVLAFHNKQVFCEPFPYDHAAKMSNFVKVD